MQSFSFNPELKVGMQAMVIGVHQPKNSHMIGKVVTVEGLADIGEVRDEWFTEMFHGVALKHVVALVTGLGKTHGFIGECSLIQQKYLMPLPPLDDDVIIEATQIKETAKC